MKTALQHLMAEAITHTTTPGGVIGVLDGNESFFVSVGNTKYEQGEAVDENTLYDIASLTKSMVTGTLCLQAIRDKALQITDQVTKFLPDLPETNPDITIGHLLTYTAVWDLPRGLSAYARGGADGIQLMQYIYDHPLKYPPGQHYHYTNTPSILLGLILEKLYQVPLHQLAKERIFTPLQMTNTRYALPGQNSEAGKMMTNNSIAPSEIDPQRGELKGTVHDEAADALIKSAFIPGNAGLFSSAQDCVSFMKGYCQGSPVFEGTYRLAEENATPHLEQPTGLGWEHASQRFPNVGHPGVLAKTGFTGCLMIIDRPHQRAGILLTNSQYPRRHATRDAVNQLYDSFASILLRDCP